MAIKNRNSSRGAQIECINFEMCPLCYGCRAYDASDVHCAKCMKNPKRNICNLKSHKPHLVARMIKHTEIVIEKEW